MSIVTTNDKHYTDIANAIRAKGVDGTFRPDEMPDAIDRIETGITPTGSIDITENGTYDVTEKAAANVAVSCGGEVYGVYGQTEQDGDPSPEFPQEIKSVESIEVKKCGKNLFDNSIGEDGKFWPYSSGVNIPVQSTRQVTASGLIDVYGGSKVTITTFLSSDGVAVVKPFVSLNDTGGKSGIKAGNVIACDGSKQVYTYDIPQGVKYIAITFDTDKKDMVQVEFGNKATPYTPFKEPISRIITPPKPLNRIGEYADMLDVVRGVWEYNLKSFVVDKIATFNRVGGHVQIATNDVWDTTTYNFRAFAAYFEAGTYGTLRTARLATVADSGWQGKSRLQITNRYSDDKDVFEAAVLGKMAVVPIPTPTTEPVAPEDLNFLRNLTLAEGDTLTITDNWGRELEYVANINDIYDDYTASLVLLGLRG